MGGLAAKFKGSSNGGEPKKIVVFGATGAQGGSLVRALKDDKDFVIRAVTRNTESDKAKALAEQGIEVVAADLDDVETLKKATEGAYGVFVVTNYWESMDKDKEIQQGKNIADACKESNVRHVVASLSESVKNAIDKECAHFDSKGEIEAYMKQIGLPLTSVYLSFYCENLVTMLKPQKGEDDEFTLNLPMEGKVMDMVPVAETGECVRQIFKNFKKYKGKSVGLSSQKSTIAEYAEILTNNVEGKTFKAGEVTAEQFGELGFPGAAELAVMFEYYQSLKLDRDVKLTKTLNPNISDFATWVKNNVDVINAALE